MTRCGSTGGRVKHSLATVTADLVAASPGEAAFEWEAVLSCEWCLDKNNHQGWYGECFVQVLAAAAGLQASALTPDCTGVDFDISAPVEIRGDFPAMRVQVKTWARPKGDKDDWIYPRLTQKRFNALAGGERRIPRFLFLVIVPDDVSEYAKGDQEGLLLSHAAYWLSLADRDQIESPRCNSTVTVRVPKKNILTVKSLRELLDPDLAEVGS
ncbi:DUF4365 domain-containing protein [Spongiactinospora rosea]|uniref:DUF4365 domain-containing protein n=1 Tax=Spongiactinospora rosea TaxID=2248750 RepID=A0A366M3I6_9ACTN|nr:DUF4365 domain-containing protein [Spongiactinospora rosea]RBQ20607.1 DUF4365 domain-containing protein [Spongiactinospora rosea]